MNPSSSRQSFDPLVNHLSLHIPPTFTPWAESFLAEHQDQERPQIQKHIQNHSKEAHLQETTLTPYQKIGDCQAAPLTLLLPKLSEAMLDHLLDKGFNFFHVSAEHAQQEELYLARTPWYALLTFSEAQQQKNRRFRHLMMKHQPDDSHQVLQAIMACYLTEQDHMTFETVINWSRDLPMPSTQHLEELHHQIANMVKWRPDRFQHYLTAFEHSPWFRQYKEDQAQKNQEQALNQPRSKKMGCTA